jgi:hypothetical protein
MHIITLIRQSVYLQDGPEAYSIRYRNLHIWGLPRIPQAHIPSEVVCTHQERETYPLPSINVKTELHQVYLIGSTFRLIHNHHEPIVLRLVWRLGGNERYTPIK